MKSNFTNHFNYIKEFRQEGKIKHKLIDIIFIVVASMIANCDTWDEIGLFEKARKEWLNKY